MNGWYAVVVASVASVSVSVVRGVVAGAEKSKPTLNPCCPTVGAPPSESLLEIVTTPHGGHCGYIESLRDGNWVDGQVVKLLSRNPDS